MSTLQLQVNTAGSWKNVILFDQAQLEVIKQATQALHEAATDSYWRIAVGAGKSPDVLGHIGSSTYGVWIMKGSAA